MTNISELIKKRLDKLSHIKSYYTHLGYKQEIRQASNYRSLLTEFTKALSELKLRSDPEVLPVLFYINEDQHMTKNVDIYHRGDGWIEAIIPRTPNVHSIILIGQYCSSMELGTSYLVSGQHEGKGICTPLSINDDLILDLSSIDRQGIYDLDPGAMLFVSPDSGKDPAAELLISFKPMGIV